MTTLVSEENVRNTTPQSSVDNKTSLATHDGGGKEGSRKEPGENDVLCGRGGSINSHPGNERFRQLVEKRKRVYLTARFKREKRLIASSIVSEIRALDPPGHFLTRDSKLQAWVDIGDEKARDKTSQALRENAPSIRAELETEINGQRAEMQRVEEQQSHCPTATTASLTATQQPPPPYYNQNWGYPPSSYYNNYGHPVQHPLPPHPVQQPPPPHPTQHPPPPIPSAVVPPHGAPHPGYPPYEGQWGTGPHPHYLPPPGYGSHPVPPQSQQHPVTNTPKSTVQLTTDLVTSGAESIKNWTKQSLGFNTVNSTVTPSTGEDQTISSEKDKPIAYEHKDDSKKRRMVTFQDHQNNVASGQPRSRPSHASVQSNNSVLDVMDDDEEDEEMEPQSISVPSQHDSSFMTQVANQLLGSLNSWDASTFCGHGDSDEPVPFPKSAPQSQQARDATEVDWEEDDMAGSWGEGQEVMLTVPNNDHNSVSSSERMPPPARQKRVTDQASSVGFSSIGSCHSWMPDQLSEAASYFSLSRGSNGNTGVSPSNSMDMTLEHSIANTDNYSSNRSLGGGSLTRVFEHEPLHPEPLPSPNMNQRSLIQMPSWERNLRNRSPATHSSADDESLISKTSSKLSDGGAISPVGGMQWETETNKE